MMLSDINDNGDILIECFCGCGKLIPCIDDKGRSRRYKVGHNRRKTKIMPNDVMIEISKITSLSIAKDILLNQSKIIYEQKIENEEQYKEIQSLKAILHHIQQQQEKPMDMISR